MANTYTLISKNVLSGSAASVTFSSIPDTYTDLVLRASLRNDDTQTWGHLHFQINNDTTSTYSWTYLYGNGSSAASATSGNNTSTRAYYSVNGSTATNNTFSNTEIYIPSYAASQNKPIFTFGVNETNSATAGDANIAVTADLWRNTAAITSIKFGASSNFSTVNFVSGSTFYLYGIKNS